MIVNSIDELIERLNEIITCSTCERDSYGHFATLYRVTTMRIREAIYSGRFADGARMERLVVIFANRYLEALTRFRKGEETSRCWFVSFESACEPRLAILKHLLLGMNAHINFDLAIATAETCTAGGIVSLKCDFDEINKILAEALVEVRERVLRDSYVRTVLCRFLFIFDDALINFSLACARARAWRITRKLSRLNKSEWGREVDGLDQRAAILGYLMCGPVRQRHRLIPE